MLNKQGIVRIRREVGDDEEILPSLFTALSDPGRYRIFKLLLKHRDLCVTDVANIMKVSVPAASQQLKILELSGLIVRQRQGQKICYHIQSNNQLVRVVTKLIAGLK